MTERDPSIEPPPLPGDALALLAAYRKDEAMPKDARARVWREIAAEPPRAGRVAAPAGRWGFWVGGGLAAAAVILLGVHLLGGVPSEAVRAIDPRPQTAPDRAVGRDSEGDASSRRAPARDRVSAEPVPEPVASEPATNEPAANEPATTHAADPRGPSSKPRAKSPRVPAPTPASEPTPASAPVSDLAAERELIAAAWRALAKGSPEKARTHAEAHARRFPRGMLAPEREAVHAIAACRDATAPRPELADAFARAHPKSPLAARVREACDRATP